MAAPDLNFNFDTVAVKQEIQEVLKLQLPKFGFPNVRVLTSDPQSPAELPCIGINRVNDDETSLTMGDNHGISYDAPSQVYTTEQGTFFAEAMEIRVWETNADERDKLFRLVKAILFAYRMTWVEKGLLNITLRAGHDAQDSSMQSAPSVMYWAVLTMAYLNPLNVDILRTGVAPISAFSDGGPIPPTP